MFIIVQLVVNTFREYNLQGKSWAYAASLGYRFGSVYTEEEELGIGKCCEVEGGEKPMCGESHQCYHEILYWLSVQGQYPSQRLGLPLLGSPQVKRVPWRSRIIFTFNKTARQSIDSAISGFTGPRHLSSVCPWCQTREAWQSESGMWSSGSRPWV